MHLRLIERCAGLYAKAKGLGRCGSTMEDIERAVERGVAPFALARVMQPQLREGEHPSEDPVHTEGAPWER